ncbi:hypothetical protein HanPI659440_Chr02g0083521 [Helianthus annuus]|nr:hypothetical protein HanPI659440_Chr02g0083521 [Helianthus annuus]
MKVESMLDVKNGGMIGCRKILRLFYLILEAFKSKKLVPGKRQQAIKKFLKLKPATPITLQQGYTISYDRPDVAAIGRSASRRLKPNPSR